MPDITDINTSDQAKLAEAIDQSKTALKQMGLAVLIAVGAAGAQILAEALPGLSQAVLPFLPSWFGQFGGGIVAAAVAFAVAALKKYAAANHIEAVSKAAESPAQSIKHLYGRQ